MDIHKNSAINNQIYIEMQNKDNYGDDNRSNVENSFFHTNNTDILSYGMVYSHEIKNINQLKVMFKKSISLLDELDDPLDVFNSYIQWLQLNYQSIENFSIEEDVIPIITRALKLLNGDPRYINDIRYLKFWVIYSSFVDDPISIFEFLEKNNLCLKLAAYYEEFSKLKELEKNFDEARKIYHVGIKRKARPFPRLRRNYEAFKRRMEFLKQHQDNEFYRVPININNETLDSKSKKVDLSYNSIEYIKNNYEYSQDEISKDDELQLSDLNVIEHDIDDELKHESNDMNFENSFPIIKKDDDVMNNIELENKISSKNLTSHLNIFSNNKNKTNDSKFNESNIIKINSKKMTSDVSYNNYKYMLNNQWNYLNCKVFEYKGEKITFEELRALINGYQLNNGDISSTSDRRSDIDMDIDHDEMFEEIFTNISANISNNSKGNVSEKNSIFPSVSNRNRIKNYKSSLNNNLTFNIDPKYYDETMEIDKYNKEELVTPNKKINLDYLEDSPSPIDIDNGVMDKYIQKDIIDDNEAVPVYHTQNKEEVISLTNNSFISEQQFDEDKSFLYEPNIKNKNKINSEDIVTNDRKNYNDKDIINKLKSSINDLDRNVNHMKETIKIVDEHDEKIRNSEVNGLLRSTVNSIFDSKEINYNDYKNLQDMNNLSIGNLNNYTFNQNNLSNITPKNLLTTEDIQSPIKVKKTRARHNSQMILNMRNKDKIFKKSDIMDEIYKREKEPYDNNYSENDINQNDSDDALPTYVPFLKSDINNNNLNKKYNKNSNKNRDNNLHLNQSMEKLNLSSSIPYHKENYITDDSDSENNIVNHFSSVKKSVNNVFFNGNTSNIINQQQNTNNISPKSVIMKKERKLKSISSQKNEISIIEIRTSNPYVDQKFNDVTDDYFVNLIKGINDYIVSNNIIDYTKRPEFLKLKYIIEDYTKATGNKIRNPSPTLLEDEIKKGISYVFYENNSCKVIQEIGRGEFSKIYLVGLNSLDDELNSGLSELSYSDIKKRSLSLPSINKRIKLALKIQHNTINSMEYYNIQKLHQRARCYEGMDSSFINVKQLYKYKNACHILMEYCEFGSLLDALNYQFHIKTDISSNAAMANTYDTLLNHSIKSISSALNGINTKSKSRSSKSNNKMLTADPSLSTNMKSKEKIYQCISSINDYEGLDEAKKIHEVLAVFYTIEILKIVETLHQSNIIHSDIKADNFMLRMPLVESYKKFFNDDKELCSAKYCKEGQQGWNNYGLTLIDFGQSIDLTDFNVDGNIWFRQAASEIEFNSSTQSLSSLRISNRKEEINSNHRKKTGSTYDKLQGNQCWEIRHHQPYLYEIDWYGVAGVIHALLFNEYMEIYEDKVETETDYNEDNNELQENISYTIYDYSGQDKKPIKKNTYSSSKQIFEKKPHLRILKTFKRYWQRELWQRLFDVLLNAKTVNVNLNLDSLYIYTQPNNISSNIPYSSSTSPIYDRTNYTSNSSLINTTYNLYYEQRFPKIKEIREIRQEFENWLMHHDHSSQYNLLGYLRLLSAQCIAINKF